LSALFLSSQFFKYIKSSSSAIPFSNLAADVTSLAALAISLACQTQGSILVAKFFNVNSSALSLHVNVHGLSSHNIGVVDCDISLLGKTKSCLT